MLIQQIIQQPVSNATVDFSAPPPDQNSRQQQLFSTDNGYDSTHYRTSSMYGTYLTANRLRQFNVPTQPGHPDIYTNDTSLSPLQSYNMTATDVFGTSGTRSDLIQASRGFEYTNSINPSKFVYNNIDPYGSTSNINSVMVQSNHSSKFLLPQQSHHGYLVPTVNQSNQTFSNGVVTQSQTPYGPHLTSNNGTTTGSVLNNNGSTGNGASQEEISTIFVVGFPDDMQEREFQNMFTFSSGFEAATLKIPNKDSTAYGSGVTGFNSSQSVNAPRIGSFSVGYPQPTYSMLNEHYNIANSNHNGEQQSWPLGTIEDSTFGGPMNSAGGHVNNTTGGIIGPRKQIIGFAKFRTRADALSARDLLQGRRVDIEKGAVLKAEMAKKNLHTKRGVGPISNLPLASIVTASNTIGSIQGSQNSIVSPETLPHISSFNGFNGSASSAGEALSVRDRELGTLGAMGLGVNLQRRDRYEGQEDNDDRRRRDVGLMSVFSSRGPRERGEDDEREHERKKKEKDIRLRSITSATFEAFHSVNDAGKLRTLSSSSTSQSSALGPLTSSMMLSPPEGLSAYPFPNVTVSSPISSDLVGSTGGSDTWPDNRMPVNGRCGAMTIPISAVSNESYSLSSARNFCEVMSDTQVSQSFSSRLSDGGSNFAPLSATSTNTGLTQHTSATHCQSQQISSSHGDVLRQEFYSNPTPLPMSSMSSVSSPHGSGGSSIEEEVTRVMRDGTNEGSISPQLPSPGSGGSGFKSNGSDQNPPINTLYVGNLPTSPVLSGYPINYLEDTIRSLFQKCPGYRKLCFRQKSNGPMCFIEFDDVIYATKALNELYGHNLGGLVKGGIRLSYSKNPLGVRSPTLNINTSGNSQQILSQQPSVLTPIFGTKELDRQFGDPTTFDGQTFRGFSGDVLASLNHTTSPPPRYISPPPSSAYSSLTEQSNNVLSRTPQNFGLTASSNFSSFGLISSPHSSMQMSFSDPSESFSKSLISEAASTGC